MSNVIQFAKPKGSDDGEWLLNMSIYAHPQNGTSAFLTDHSETFNQMEHSEFLRLWADKLDDISFLLRQQAERIKETDRGEALVVVTVFSGGIARVRTNCDKVQTEEQRSWVRGMIDAAKTDENLIEVSS